MQVGRSEGDTLGFHSILQSHKKRRHKYTDSNLFYFIPYYGKLVMEAGIIMQKTEEYGVIGIYSIFMFMSVLFL